MSGYLLSLEKSWLKILNASVAVCQTIVSAAVANHKAVFIGLYSYIRGNWVFLDFPRKIWDNGLMKMKTCRGCNIEKPITEFYHYKHKHRNNSYPNSNCKPCDHIRNRKYHTENRTKVSKRQVATHRVKRYGVSEKASVRNLFLIRHTF